MLRHPGKIGHRSAAAKYAAATATSDFSIESEKPYAEVSSLELLGSRIHGY